MTFGIIDIVHFLACFKKKPQRPICKWTELIVMMILREICIINSWISIIIKSFSSIFLVYHYLVMSVLNRMAYLLESTFSLYLNSNYLTRRTLVTILRIIPKHFSQTMLPKGKIILYYQKYEDTSEPLKLIIMK